MELFTPVVETDKFHPHFARALQPNSAASRAELQRWADGFPDRDGKLLQEFQTTFNSSFWEIYLYALFREYGFEFDWSKASPDFALTHSLGTFIVEAVTANSADGKSKEWERDQTKTMHELVNLDIPALNHEAMVRLSGALLGKLKSYRNKYAQLDHVKGKPFVVAIAPFEQPHFQHQYDRPIRAVLYDYYIDEEAYKRDPSAYPGGPPGRSLGFIEKENGSSIPLGIFLNDEWSEVSAVLFSCTATWGKVDVLAEPLDRLGVVSALWGGPPDGKPYPRSGAFGEYKESISDGLMVFHNPNAKRPLDPGIFRRQGVVQHYFDHESQDWVYEEIDNCLQIRMMVMNIHPTEGKNLPPA